MIKPFLKKVIKAIGIDTADIYKNLCRWSLRSALSEQGASGLLERLRSIEPNLSKQYSVEHEMLEDYMELKLRGMHVFQCLLMLEALKQSPGEPKKTIVDIGDSAGTHMRYIKELTKGELDISTLSVNLDKRAVEKIRAKGLDALLCRAEELDLGERKVDLFVSFEMVEHLHNPAIFFRRMAKRSKGDRMLITVPYIRRSRVGLHNVRNGNTNTIYAEDGHVFELSPEDWSLIITHAGWRVASQKIYFQYPRRLPVISGLLANYWKSADYEGFWGAILEKDTSVSDLYADWEE